MQFFFNLQVFIFLESGQLITNRWILLLLMMFVTDCFLLWAFRMVIISFDETEYLWCSFLKAWSWRFVGRNRAVEWAHHSSGVWFILLNEVFRWSLLTRHIPSKHIKIEWCLGIQSPQLRLMQLSYSIRRKVSHLTGVARPGCVCSLSHSFRSSSGDGDHDSYTKWPQSMYALRWKAQTGEIVLAFCVG